MSSYPARVGVQRVSAKKRRLARRMRQVPTAAEARVWAVIRGRGVEGSRWRQQAPLLGFIVDFYCPRYGLVIEVDGSVHDTPEAQRYDARRTAALEGAGLRVIRLTNDETLEPNTIFLAVRDALPQSPP